MRCAFANVALARILLSSVRISVVDTAPAESAMLSFCRELRSDRRFVCCKSGLGSLSFPYKLQCVEKDRLRYFQLTSVRPPAATTQVEDHPVESRRSSSGAFQRAVIAPPKAAALRQQVGCARPPRRERRSQFGEQGYRRPCARKPLTINDGR